MELKQESNDVLNVTVNESKYQVKQGEWKTDQELDERKTKIIWIQ